jgi:hypothetical protein
LGLYKKYFSLINGIPIDNIETQFIIFKRKIWENSDFPQPRTSKYNPPSGKVSLNKYSKLMDEFIQTCFTEDGKYDETKDYPVAKYAASCKWCPYKNHETIICPKWEKKRKKKLES